MLENITRNEALELIFSHWRPEPKTEEIPLGEAYGRVLARDYYSLHNIPVVRASAMDGVAVMSERFKDGVPDASDWKLGEDYVRADTGDDFDDKFDAVIRIEDVELLPGGGLKIKNDIAVTPGAAVRGSGSSLKTGAKLTNKGLPLRGTDLAALAMGGIETVEVYKGPRVAFIPTGSELIPAGAPLKRGCNYDTNSIIAENMLREMGAEPVRFPIVKDDKALLKESLDKALSDCDVVIINGGSSKGDEDFNTRLLEQQGKLLFHWVAAGPGRPISIAICAGKPVINLAGPSVGMFFGMDWCVRAVVSSFLGLPSAKRETVRATLAADLRCAPRFDFLNFVEVYRSGGKYYVQPRERGKADMASTLISNALFVSPAGESSYPAGTEIEVELLRNAAYIPELEGEDDKNG